MTFSATINGTRVAMDFRHGVRPEKSERVYIQESAKTSAGVTVTQDYRAKTPLYTLSWSNMPLADKTALQAFFNSVAGMATPFTWTRYDATTKQVRFAVPELTFVEKSYQVYSVSLQLMEVF